MAGGSLAERRDAHQQCAVRLASNQSRSAFRLIAAPHVHVIQTPLALDTAVQIAAVLVLLKESVERGEERHARECSVIRRPPTLT
jgi:hypothetical protein